MRRLSPKTYATGYAVAVLLTAIVAFHMHMAEWFFLLIVPFFYSVFLYGRALNYTLLALLTLVTFTISITVSDAPYTSGGNTLALALVMVCALESIIWAVKRLRRFTLIVEQMTDCVIVADMAGRITYVNPAFEKTTGYSRAEVTGQDLGILASNRAGPPLNDMLRCAMETCGSSRGRVISKRKDGALYTAETTISPLRGPAGDVFRYVVVQHDITRELRLEEQFNHAQKMEAIGQLASSVAHDFNNLLQVIQGYIELALRESSPESATHKSLVRVMRAAESAADLVRQLLAFSRKQSLQLEVIDVSEVVGSFARLFNRIIGAHIAVEINLEPGPQRIRADKGQIEQVLMNLCVNARDAIGESGTLVIQTGTTQLDEAFCETNTWARPGAHAVLTVSDTGCGMDEETQRRIFEPFFTTKQPGEGTGLGLATVYGIVQQHGGMVTVSSEAGVGTTFRLYFPLVEATDGHLAEEVGARAPGGTETLLLAEDNSEVRGLTEAVLREAGYQVLTAHDGDEAIRMLTAHADKIALALLDVFMPRRSGRAVVEYINEHNLSMRVLLVSGQNVDAPDSNSPESGEVECIMKPFSDVELLRTVRRVLDAQ